MGIFDGRGLVGEPEAPGLEGKVGVFGFRGDDRGLSVMVTGLPLTQ